MTSVSYDIAKRYNILLIDDDQAHTNLMTLILSEHCDCLIINTSSAVDSRETSKKISPDLIILRLMMNGRDGYNVCRQLKSETHLQQIPVLLFGAKAPRDVYEQAKYCGATGYLSQPFTPTQLCQAYDTLLSGKTYFP